MHLEQYLQSTQTEDPLPPPKRMDWSFLSNYCSLHGRGVSVSVLPFQEQNSILHGFFLNEQVFRCYEYEYSLKIHPYISMGGPIFCQNNAGWTS